MDSAQERLEVSGRGPAVDLIGMMRNTIGNHTPPMCGQQTGARQCSLLHAELSCVGSWFSRRRRSCGGRTFAAISSKRTPSVEACVHSRLESQHVQPHSEVTGCEQ